MQYILAHDLGTSGNKATLYGVDGRLYASVLAEYPTFYPHPNWVEQNADDWWEAVCTSTRALMQKAGVNPRDILCVSFSAQMMGCLLVDKQGKPLRPMILWADTRATQEEAWMQERVPMQEAYRIIGHRISASYSAAKLLWVRSHEPDVYARAYKMLHAKDFIIHKLTGEFVSDYSDASSTNLFDINQKTWSQKLLDAWEIPLSILPVAHPSTDIAGVVHASAARATGLCEGTPVVIGGGDGSCACVGAGVVQKGKTYNVIGSSSWVSMADTAPFYDEQMRTFNWVHLDPNLYTPCATMQTAGYSLNWAKRNLCDMEVEKARQQGKNPYQLIDEEIASSPAGANHLLFLPYLLGERSPRWNPDAKGCFVGMQMTTTKADMLRAILEGVGYNLKILIDIFEKNEPIDQITVIGGGAKGDVWLQILADIWQKPVIVPAYLEEATSMGAAICGGVGVKAFENFQVIHRFNPPTRTILPNAQNAGIYKALYPIFDKAYHALCPVFDQLAALSR